MSGVPKFWQRNDRVAVVVFEQAQQAGEPVSMGLVKRIIAELDETPPRRRCSSLNFISSVAATTTTLVATFARWRVPTWTGNRSVACWNGC